MRIKTLTLHNFRGFSHAEFNFLGAQTVVLVGVNGSGKSSVLEALAMAMSTLINNVTSAKPFTLGLSDSGDYSSDPSKIHLPALRPINDKDFRRDANSCSLKLDVRFHDVHETIRVYYERTSMRNMSGKHEGGKNLINFFLGALLKEPRSSLPIGVYYPANREVRKVILDLPEEDHFDQMTAYEGAFFGGKIDFRSFFEWYRMREDYENERIRGDAAYRDPELEAVRTAVYNFLGDAFSDLRVRRSPYLKMIVKKRQEELEINQLSDGEKCSLAIAGDIARRLALANPLMSDPLMGKGTIFIDEIDLHLHPGWQREVIPALERTFPNCQFIVATHSPQVLSAAKDAIVYLLAPSDDGIQIRRLTSPFGRDTNYILEAVLGVTERPDSIKKKIDEYLDLIDSGDRERAERMRTELVQEIGPDDSELVRADVLMRRKEILGR